jgi:hypothetical protein
MEAFAKPTAHLHVNMNVEGSVRMTCKAQVIQWPLLVLEVHSTGIAKSNGEASSHLVRLFGS